MSAKKKAVKRKPRQWLRWAHLRPDGSLLMLHPDVSVTSARKLGLSLGVRQGEYFRVRITEVIK